MTNITIDNKEITAPAGSTILEAARSAGIYIPVLCNHADLPVYHSIELSDFVFQGSKKIIHDAGKTIDSIKGCGICIVQQEGIEQPVASCQTEVADGMKFQTDTDTIRQKRQQNLIRYMADHPHACLTCSQHEGCIPLTDVCPGNVPVEERCCSLLNMCELQKVVDYVGVAPETPRYRPEADAPTKITDEPLFVRDYRLCVDCGRCVRVCQSVRGVGALGAVISNGELVVGTTTQSPSLNEAECRFCGFCVEVCPTGALTDKNMNRDKESALVPCRSSCPAEIDIPRYLRYISEGKLPEAAAVIREKVPFGGVLGYVCFHPCEQVCRHGDLNESISVCSLKRAAFEKDDDSWKKNLKISPETGKKVAIVGSGPAGLTTAYYLAKKGHKVTVFEAQPKAGGMLRYGIPKYRLPRAVLDKEIEDIKELGVAIKTNEAINGQISLNDLQSQGYSTIFLAVGTQLSKKFNLEGTELKRVFWGLDFLKELNAGRDLEVSKRVVVIGGGNVAIDVAMSAIRLGAEEVQVVCLESQDEIPAYEWEVTCAKEEGVKINTSWGPKEIIGNDGKVTGVEFVRCTRVFDEAGRFNPVFNEDDGMTIETDVVILAIGQTPDLSFINGDLKIKTNSVGGLWVKDETMETNLSGIFAGGDIVTNPKSVIEAIAAGRKAAESIDKYLGGNGDISDKLITETKVSFWIGMEQGFANKKRVESSSLPVTERTKDFAVIEQSLDENTAILEAKRCLQCDLRLHLQPVILPPEKWLPFSSATVKDVPELAGVFQLFDKDNKVITISGSANLRQALDEKLSSESRACFFFYEEEPMFTQRETELIQKYVQVHGQMPEGNSDLDDLF